MEKKETPDARPIPTKPEINSPSEKEQKEVSTEQKELEQGSSKEQLEKQEVPNMPPDVPEIKPAEAPKTM